MTHFRRITKRDDKTKLAEAAAKYEALLAEALKIARQMAEAKPVLVQQILATGVVEGLSSNLKTKTASVSYRAEKYRRTWHTLTPWQYLDRTTPEEQAELMVMTVEDNIHMTETNSWPSLPKDPKGAGADRAAK